MVIFFRCPVRAESAALVSGLPNFAAFRRASPMRAPVKTCMYLSSLALSDLCDVTVQRSGHVGLPADRCVPSVQDTMTHAGPSRLRAMIFYRFSKWRPHVFQEVRGDT